MPQIHFSARESIVAASFVLYFSLALFPVLKSGFYSDDILDVQSTQGVLVQDEITLLELVKRHTQFSMNNGRFAPLSYLVQRSFCYYLDDAFHQKALVFFLNLLAIASFYFFLSAFSLPGLVIFLALLLLPAFFQFRIMYHDAYTTFSGMYPILAILNFNALTFFVRFLKHGKIRMLFTALLLFLLALLFFDITLIFLPFYLLAIFWFGKKEKKITQYVPIMPFALATLFYLGFIFYLRTHIPEGHYQYEGLQTSFEPMLMLKVLHSQIFSVIPLSYLNYELNFISTPPDLVFQQMKTHTPVLILAAISFLFIILLFNQWKKLPAYFTKSEMRRGLMLAVLLLLLPAMIIMISKKYQSFALPGNGYIPVYFQNFGGAILFALFIARLISVKNVYARSLGAIFVVLFLLAVNISLANNFRLVEVMNERVYHPGLALEKALEDNLFASVKDHDIILLKNNFHGEMTQNYQYLFTGKTAKTVTVLNFENEQQCAQALHDSRACFTLSFPQGHPNVVTLTRLKSSAEGKFIPAEVIKREYFLRGNE